MLSKKIIFTCFLAGCLEIYDFTIFGYLSDALHENYFTFLDETFSLIATYILFAVGFVFRPLGAILFGYIGDKYGRKYALVISISLMGIASLGMCILPSYNYIGIYSCYILVFLRILQGFSVGGEYSGAIIFAVEHSENRKAGFVGSLVVSGCMSGVLLATLVNKILKMPEIPEYYWRFAFLLGFILSVIGYFIRKKLHETPEFIAIKKATKKAQFRNEFKISDLEILSTIFIAGTSGVNLYFISVFMPNYIKHLGDSVYNLSSISTLIMSILIPLFGYISDKIGMIKVMLVGSGFLVVYTLFMPAVIFSSKDFNTASIAVIIHAVIAAVFCGPMNTLIIKLFSASKRYSHSAFSYSIGMGFIGGTSPMVSTLITNNQNNSPIYLGIYISSISLLGLISIVSIRKRYLNKL